MRVVFVLNLFLSLLLLWLLMVVLLFKSWRGVGGEDAAPPPQMHR